MFLIILLFRYIIILLLYIRRTSPGKYCTLLLVGCTIIQTGRDNGEDGINNDNNDDNKYDEKNDNNKEKNNEKNNDKNNDEINDKNKRSRDTSGGKNDNILLIYSLPGLVLLQGG